MANVLDILKPLAQPSTNGFDLSQKHVYGSAPGRLDAPLMVETMPRDKFKINLGALMRTYTPETAPFLRGKVVFDFYFVPYSQIWHPFNQFVDQRLDIHSTRQLGCKYVPVISLYGLLLFLYDCAVHLYNDSTSMDDYKDIEGVSWYANIWHMLDFFGYGNFLWYKKEIEDHTNTRNDIVNMIGQYASTYVNIFRPAAYQHIWYDLYRNKFYDNYEYQADTYAPDYVSCFNFDDIKCDSFANSVIPIAYDGTSFADDCESNKRVIMLFTQRYVQYKQDIFQSALPSQQFGAVSDVSIDFSGSTMIHGTASLDGTTGSDENRWTEYDGNPMKDNLPVHSNNVGRSLSAQSADDSGYHTVKHDHVISGSANVQASAGFTGHGAFDVITLKRAEALQKWRQNVMRAGNMVDDSFRAHFGVTPRYEADNNVLKLGSFEGGVNVNVVETTAQSNLSGNNKVGNLGSSVTCTISGREIQFSCSDFGVIMCTQYFRPESEYSSTMIDRANTLYEPFDFPTPELCNIGLNPITLADLNPNDQTGFLNTVLGFASQYWWYKSAFDKCHGQFASFNYGYNSQHRTYSIFKGDSIIWCAPRKLIFAHRGVSEIYRSKQNLYVDPNMLNDMMGVVYYDPNLTDLQKQDNLIFNTYFDIKVIRALTVVGLPNF